jgi:hypothetical protein
MRNMRLARYCLAALAVMSLAGCEDSECGWNVTYHSDFGDQWNLQLDGTAVPIDLTNSYFVYASAYDQAMLRVATTTIASFDLRFPLAVSELTAEQQLSLTVPLTTLERKDAGPPYQHFWEGTVSAGTMLVIDATHDCEEPVCAHSARAKFVFSAQTDVGAIEFSGVAVRTEDLEYLCVKCPGFEGCES